jgi:hypothetical protein
MFFVGIWLIAGGVQEIIIYEQVSSHFQACVLNLNEISITFIVIRNMISGMLSFCMICKVKICIQIEL